MINVAIIGAGPYGLSLAAHLRSHDISFRIFGRPMDSWRAHMPKGMFLKSDGFASNIYDPNGEFSLQRFCAEQGKEYSDTGIPVSLENFVAYGLAFKERMVPELEDRLVVAVERKDDGYLLLLDDGETVLARRVVLAVGITHFEYLPANLANLPSEFLSHSFRHHDLEEFRGRSVVVVGAGASALDLAALLHEGGAETQLVGRAHQLKFHSTPTGKPRSWWQQVRHPQSGLGPGMRSRFFANSPMAFHLLPESLRLHAVRTTLGPSGGWFVKDKVVGRLPLHLGYSVQATSVQSNRLRLNLRPVAGGKELELCPDHVIAATGYRVAVNRLKFLSSDIRTKIKAIDGAPILSSGFESSVPGLYFVGIAAANSFGPVMRFAFGAGFAARQVTKTLMAARSRDAVSVPASGLASTAD